MPAAQGPICSPRSCAAIVSIVLTVLRPLLLRQAAVHQLDGPGAHVRRANGFAVGAVLEDVHQEFLVVSIGQRELVAAVR